MVFEISTSSEVLVNYLCVLCDIIPTLRRLELYMSMRNLRSWYSQNSKPLESEQWRACKFAGILKPMRGKRGGRKTNVINNISTIQPRTVSYSFSVGDKRKKIGVKPKIFFNIQLRTSGSSCSEDNSAS